MMKERDRNRRIPGAGMGCRGRLDLVFAVHMNL